MKPVMRAGMQLVTMAAAAAAAVSGTTVSLLSIFSPPPPASSLPAPAEWQLCSTRTLSQSAPTPSSKAV